MCKTLMTFKATVITFSVPPSYRQPSYRFSRHSLHDEPAEDSTMYQDAERVVVVAINMMRDTENTRGWSLNCYQFNYITRYKTACF